MSKQSLLLALPLLGLLSAPGTSAAAAVTHPSPGLPMAINTWGGPFTASTDAAFHILTSSPNTTTSNDSSTTTASGTKLALDAAEAGCAACERSQCDGTVGRGGSPDERCETTLDAMIMDGGTLASGAVASLRRVRDAVSVARAVLERTSHSMLAGDLATRFAVENGFVEEIDDEGEGLSTPESREACRAWREQDDCQPNYRSNVSPDPSSSCGPYRPLDLGTLSPQPGRRQASHDTVSLITLAPNPNNDGDGGEVFMASATSTNGAAHKVPGRVGDGPIVGSGSYADSHAGGCAATGDGDVMMRFLPCYQAVESMRRGMSPGEAADDAVRRMLARYPDLAAGIVVVDRAGRHAGAACGWTFTYSYRGGDMEETKVVTVEPLNPEPSEL